MLILIVAIMSLTMITIFAAQTSIDFSSIEKSKFTILSPSPSYFTFDGKAHIVKASDVEYGWYYAGPLDASGYKAVEYTLENQKSLVDTLWGVGFYIRGAKNDVGTYMAGVHEENINAGSLYLTLLHDNKTVVLRYKDTVNTGDAGWAIFDATKTFDSAVSGTLKLRIEDLGSTIKFIANDQSVTFDVPQGTNSDGIAGLFSWNVIGDISNFNYYTTATETASSNNPGTSDLGLIQYGLIAISSAVVMFKKKY